MFRQRRKQRHEELERVRGQAQNMTIIEMIEHQRFYKILNGWSTPKISNDFFNAWDKVIAEARQKLPRSKKPNVDNVKKLLNKLNKLDKSVLKEVVELGIDNRLNFKTALQTSKTAKGIKIGGYLIKINYAGKRQSYDVIRISDEKDIALDIKLYEMAFCMVNYLNEGVLSTDPRMVELHEIYSDYMVYSDKATQYKRRYYDAIKENNSAKQEKNLDDFEKNRDIALDYKANIIDLFKKNTA